MKINNTIHLKIRDLIFNIITQSFITSRDIMVQNNTFQIFILRNFTFRTSG